MGLNIKNQRVHDLAKEAARVTGKSQTGAIEEALQRLLREYDADPQVAARRHKLDLLREIAAEFDADRPDPHREIKTIDDLYDQETGLPR